MPYRTSPRPPPPPTAILYDDLMQAVARVPLDGDRIVYEARFAFALGAVGVVRDGLEMERIPWWRIDDREMPMPVEPGVTLTLTIRSP